jgi:hypothetical protein
MGNNSYSSQISANISADEAIKRISNVPGWWGVTFTGSSEKQGDAFVVRMTKDSFFNFTVEELAPGKRIAWLVTDCYMPWYSDKTEWTGTRLLFDLLERDGITAVNFTHEGLTPAVECYKDCESGWSHWIAASLQSYLATGEGSFRPPTK